MVDFSKKLGKKSVSKSLDPLEIYETLDRESDKGPLRPAQIAICTDWHQHHRGVRDLVVKLHTGQGKTLIGLLILQSKLNEETGPALYLCPNKFLVEQTCLQAKQFGFRYCTDEGDIPQEFIDGQQILITTVQKMFNGQTRFKTGARSLPVSNIVMDDSHACADAIRDAAVIRIKHDEQAYIDIVSLFAGALEQQGAGTFADIQSGEYEAILPVPYWAWQDRQTEVVQVLSKLARPPTNPKEKPHPAWFVWPLIKDNLRDCQCVVSGQWLEIAPYLPPLDLFGSYYKAKHRVFMSATVTNDSFLVKGLRLAPETIRKPLLFEKEKWSGEKMILLPSLIDQSLERVAMVNYFGKPVAKRRFGVVALTPSFKIAEFWKACGAVVATTETIAKEVGRLRAGECDQTLAIASRYDGIDLPDSSCRILIFDSLPHAANLIDAYADGCRGLSSVTTMRTARSIEQGLGRSVRGEKDYCVIVMIGPELVKMIRSQSTRTFLSAQTRTQIDIGLEIASMAKGEIGSKEVPMDTLINLLNQCLKRDASWKQFYVEQMDSVKETAPTAEVLNLFERELTAEQKHQSGDSPGAVKTIQKLIDDFVKDENEKGWYMQEMARYAYRYSRKESNDRQLEAHRKNRYLMRPETGMQIDKLEIVSARRVANIIDWIKSFESYGELHLAVEDMLGRLDFGIKADRFEHAFNELGKALGFGSQRPEKEWKEGPDNLWALRDGEYFLVECKSEVDLKRAEIHKTESGQMNNACAWFTRNYPGAKVTRAMIIPTKKVGKAAGFNEEVFIIRASGLAKIVRSVRRFFEEFASLDLKDLSEQKVQELLDAHDLSVNALTSKHLERLIS